MTSIFNARGLTNLITDIRACVNKELEQQRVDKELAKIRNKFTQLNVLNSYDKRKYIWKLLYIFMLGYDIDFGHLQVINLLSSPKYAEKSIGYIGTSLLLKSSDELMTLVINSIRNDLVSSVSAHQCLALSCLANIGGNELAEALSGDVVRALTSPGSTSNVKKKAALCLCRMLQSNSDIITSQELEPHLQSLLDDRHLGVVTSVASLTLRVVTHNPLGYSNLNNVTALRFVALVMHKACSNEYIYYTMPSPWIQVKLLRILQLLPIPEDEVTRTKLLESMKKILSRTEATKTAKNNAVYAVLFETINLVIAYGPDVNVKLFDLIVTLLGKFLSVQEPNIRYIALETMSRLARLSGIVDSLKKHQDVVLTSLKDADVSVRRRALDLLFAICDHDNALTIVEEMINYLAIADLALREAMVLKIAILAEKFAQDLRWYVDTVFKLISIAGSVVSDDIWHRAVQIITNKEDLQRYAAEMMFQALESNHVHEITIKVGSYVLGEFGYLLADKEETSAEKQLDILLRHKKNCSMETVSLILTALIKMAHLYEGLRSEIIGVLEKTKCHVDLEIQQRSCEFYAIPSLGEEVMGRILEPIPVFPEGRESALLVRLKSQSSQEQQDHKHLEPNSTSFNHSKETSQNSQMRDKSLIMDNTDEDLLGLSGTSVKSISNEEGSSCSNVESTARSPSPVLTTISSQPSNSMNTNGNMTSQENVSSSSSSSSSSSMEYFKNALKKNQGVLFEDSFLQIGMKQEFKSSQGRIHLFYGNKSSLSLCQFQVDLSSMNGVRFQIQPIQPTISTGEQIKQQIMIECLQPFTDPLLLNVSFEHNGQPIHHSLQLPVVATCFIEPVPLQGEDFKKRWMALEGNDREQQIVFNPTQNTLDMESLQNLLSTDLHFALAHGIDSDTTLSAAGTFRTSSVAPSGDKISVGCLLRLEVNSQAKAYRITVRAVHGGVSIATKNVLVQLLT